MIIVFGDSMSTYRHLIAYSLFIFSAAFPLYGMDTMMNDEGSPCAPSKLLPFDFPTDWLDATGPCGTQNSYEVFCKKLVTAVERHSSDAVRQAVEDFKATGDSAGVETVNGFIQLGSLRLGNGKLFAEALLDFADPELTSLFVIHGLDMTRPAPGSNEPATTALYLYTCRLLQCAAECFVYEASCAALFSVDSLVRARNKIIESVMVALKYGYFENQKGGRALKDLLEKKVREFSTDAEGAACALRNALTAADAYNEKNFSLLKAGFGPWFEDLSQMLLTYIC